MILFYSPSPRNGRGMSDIERGLAECESWRREEENDAPHNSFPEGSLNRGSRPATAQ